MPKDWFLMPIKWIWPMQSNIIRIYAHKSSKKMRLVQQSPLWYEFFSSELVYQNQTLLSFPVDPSGWTIRFCHPINQSMVLFAKLDDLWPIVSSTGTRRCSSLSISVSAVFSSFGSQNVNASLSERDLRLALALSLAFVEETFSGSRKDTARFDGSTWSKPFPTFLEFDLNSLPRCALLADDDALLCRYKLNSEELRLWWWWIIADLSKDREGGSISLLIQQGFILPFCRTCWDPRA